jgi:hypothetical protein
VGIDQIEFRNHAPQRDGLLTVELGVE